MTNPDNEMPRAISRFADQCVGEHSPGDNPACIMRPAEVSVGGVTAAEAAAGARRSADFLRDTAPSVKNFTSPPLLAGFLLARIAEDEWCARSATQRDWDAVALADGYDVVRVPNSGRPLRRIRVARCGIVERGNATHIARHDPARVLAECEAKRRIVELHSDGGDEMCQSYAGNYSYAPCATLRALAAAYINHPDFRQEWRVGSPNPAFDPSVVHVETTDYLTSADVASALRDAAAYLRRQAAARFDKYGARDARGAALWDAGCAIDPDDGDQMNAGGK